MSVTQMVILFLWWQLPVIGVSGMFSHSFAKFVSLWIVTNAVTFFVIGTLWVLSQIVINWSSWA